MSCCACGSEQRCGCARGSSGGLQSHVVTRALLSSSPFSPASVRCRALPYTAPAPRTSPVITAGQTSFRGCAEGTEGGHQQDPYLTCVLSPQTKVNLPLAGHTRILHVESQLLTWHCPHLKLQLCHLSQPTSASETGSPSFPWHGCCFQVSV